jgi:hypothetical protein
MNVKSLGFFFLHAMKNHADYVTYIGISIEALNHFTLLIFVYMDSLGITAKFTISSSSKNQVCASLSTKSFPTCVIPESPTVSYAEIP